MRRLVAVSLLALAAAACSSAEPERLTVYSGRSEDLIGPLVERFESETGIGVDVRYADSAELAAQILDEGASSPADVFFAQDAGALGALRAAGRLSVLDETVLDRVDPRFRSPDGTWVGTSGRARVLVVNTDAVADAPGSVFDLTDQRWAGRVGWAPTNGSFQSFVTALREVAGEQRARSWLEAMADNATVAYEKNTPIVQAVAAGEIDVGLVNHYYLLRLATEDPAIGDAARNVFLDDDDPGALINVAGLGVLDSAAAPDAAARFVDFLLGETAQRHFAEETFEYPLIGGIDPDRRLPALDEVGAPDLDLSDLADLRGTLDLLRDTGVL